MHMLLNPAHTARALPQRQRGFTLVEMIIAIGLIGLLARVATLMWVDGFGLVTTINNDTTAIADGRILLERLSREVREVKYDVNGGVYCISTMAATQMVFNKTSGAYLNACGGATPTTTTNDFAVTIQSVGANLNLGYAGTLAAPATTRALTSYVSSFGIRYLDVAYTVTASTSTVRFVELSLTLRPPNGQNTVSRTVVALRNQ